ncbi:MAG: sodium/proline symporter, partial [Alphaproteobacteria bacterium]
MNGAGVDTSILAGLIVYLLVVLGVGIYAARFMRSLDDFLLAGRRLGAWVAALSERASGESAWFLLGLPGAAYAFGFREFWTVIGLAFGIFGSWVLLAWRLRDATGRMGALTLPDYFESRYDDKSRILRVVSMLTILIFYTMYVGAQFVGAGKILHATFGIDPVHGMLIGAGIVAFYTLMGGFLAVAWTDVIQGVLMAVVCLLLPIIGIFYVGGLDETGQALAVKGADFFTMSGGKVGKALWFGVIFGSLSWGLGYLGQPHLLTRYMAIREPKEVRKGSVIALGWVLIAYWSAAFIGIVGVAVLGTGLADAETVMPLMCKKLLPGWLAGVAISGAVAAMMSTADSQLVVVTSAIAEDIYARLIRPGTEQSRLVLISRLATLGAAVVALLLAYTNKDLIFHMVEYAWTGLGSSFGPPLLLALWWKRSTKWGALTGMLVGTFGTIIWKNSEILSGFLDLKIAAFGLSFLFTIAVSLLTSHRN